MSGEVRARTAAGRTGAAISAASLSASPGTLVGMTALAAFACVAVAALGWVGFMSSDDLYYYSAAKGWISTPWYVPGHFGQIRSSVALPISASLLVLGDREFAVVLPSVIYFVLLVGGTFVCATRVMPAGIALAQSLVFCSFPVVVSAATTPSADIAEMFWAAVAFWMFAFVWLGRVKPPLALLACGAALALAFSARETVIALGMFMAVCAVFSRRLHWRSYLWIAAGGLAVLSIEAFYYWLAAGDPLHRIRLFFVGAELSNDRLPVPAFSFDDSANLRVHVTVDALLMLLTKHHFGMAYWLLLPAAAVAFFRLRRMAAVQAVDEALRAFMLLAFAAGLVWLVFDMIALYRIKLLGRYYIGPTYLLCLGAAALVASGQVPWRRGAVAAVFVLALAVNLLGVAAENKQPRFAERTLAQALNEVQGVVVTDPRTAFYARPYVAWAGLPNERIAAGPPRPGAYFYWVEKNVVSPHRLIPKAELARYRFDPAWKIVARFQADAFLPARVASEVRRIALIPAPIMEKLVAPRGEAVLVFVPD